MNLAPLPTAVVLRAAPHLAALTILQAVLVAAEHVLIAHSTHMHDNETTLAQGRAPPDGCLVPILLAHFAELHDLLGRYHAAVHDALLAPDNDLPF